MKKLIIWSLITSSILLCTILTANIKAEETIPEFDGGYIKTVDGEYIEMKAKDVIRRVSIPNGIYIFIYYVKDKEGMLSLSNEQFKGIFVQGQHEFKGFSLHPLLKKVSNDRGVYYTPGEEIDFHSKSIHDTAYYFQPREELKDGEYVAWIERTFWLFSIKTPE